MKSEDPQTLCEPETIVAIATPPGRGGIGIVRLSGAAALRIARALVSQLPDLRPHTAAFTRVVDEEQSSIDEALLTWFAAPRSYTGEEVVEIATHGAPVVLATVVERAVAAGARLARAGEFTERAFLNGRLDLTGAEAVRDLIESTTIHQARLAAEQLGGSLAREIRPIKQHLMGLIAELEAGIDFAEDDLDTMPAAEIATRIRAPLEPLRSLLRSFHHTRLLREGVRLAIVGRPNAGKSSLFNRLIDRDRAIVTAVPGTTRDVLRERALIGGIPLELLDTAGLRDTDDEVERIGVARSREAAAEADLILQVVDATLHAGGASLRPTLLDTAIAEDGSASLTTSSDTAPDTARALLVFNKSDLLTSEDRSALQRSHPRAILTSAAKGEGIETLRTAVAAWIGAEPHTTIHAALTNLRQRDAVARAADALSAGETAAAQNVPHEMLLLNFYEALHALDDLTGATTADAILHQIFSTFCIGK